MEIRIGISDSSQPVAVTLPSGTDHQTVKAAVDDSLRGAAKVLWLTDDQGREVAVASSRITHVEIGPPGSHPIGFG